MTLNSLSGRLGAAALAIAAGLAAAGPAAAADPAFGLWLTENKRAIVEIGPCAANAQQACGTVVWMLEPKNADGSPRLDVENEDESLRTRPLCGLPVVGDFKAEGPGKWVDGFIYDAPNGDLYDAKMTSTGADTLEVRGFLAISLLGKTQTWTRVDDKRGGC